MLPVTFLRLQSLTVQNSGRMRYHNKLYYASITGDSSRDESGNFIPKSVDFVFGCYCRDESNSFGRKVSNGEGSHVEYTSLVYAPADCPILNAGDLVEVKDVQGALRTSGTVLRFSKDRYNCRIWL